jgi:hypothetical protein
MHVLRLSRFYPHLYQRRRDECSSCGEILKVTRKIERVSDHQDA